MVEWLDVDSLDTGKLASEVSASEFEAVPPTGSADFEYNMVVPHSDISPWPSLGAYIKSDPNGILGDIITKMQEAGRYQGKQVDVDNAFYVTVEDTTDALDSTPNFAEL